MKKFILTRLIPSLILSQAALLAARMLIRCLGAIAELFSPALVPALSQLRGAELSSPWRMLPFLILIFPKQWRWRAVLFIPILLLAAWNTRVNGICLGAMLRALLSYLSAL